MRIRSKRRTNPFQLLAGLIQQRLVNLGTHVIDVGRIASSSTMPVTTMSSWFLALAKYAGRMKSVYNHIFGKCNFGDVHNAVVPVDMKQFFGIVLANKLSVAFLQV